MSTPWSMILILFLPAGGALLLGTAFRRHSAWQIRTLQGTALAVLALTLSLYRDAFAGNTILSGELPGLNLVMSLQLDRFSYLFILLVSLVGLIAVWTSCSCLPGQEASLRYRMLLLTTLGAVCGVFLAGDLITLFMFYELMTVLSVGLVFGVGHPQGEAAGRTYLLFGMLSGLFLLAGIIALQYQGSSLQINEIAASTGLLVPLLLLIGFGIKAGMLPFHGWMPPAYGTAPSSGAAVLSGVLSKVGVYGILRVALIFPLPMVGSFLNVVGVAAMLWGGLAAVRQTEPREILAYSSISQIGFILMGVGSGILLGGSSSYGFQGAVFHAFNHGLFKSGLFLTAGVLLQGACRKGREMILAAAGVFMLGMIGIPFLSGGASKTLLHHAWSDILRVQGPLFRWPGEVFFVLIGALTVVYCYRLYRILAEKPDFGIMCVDLGPGAYWPMLAGALVVIGIGVFPQIADQFLVSQSSVSLVKVVAAQTSWLNYYVWEDILVVLVILGVAAGMIRWIDWNTLDTRPVSRWYSGDPLYQPWMRLSWYVAVAAGYYLEENFQTMYDRTARRGAYFILRGYTIEERIQQVYDDASKRGADFISRTFFEDVDRWNLDTAIRVVSVIMAFLMMVFFIRYFFAL